jgi:biopolymer transport protein ExbD
VKCPRNARIFRGQLDAALFAAVFFLLVIFLMLGAQVYTPGVKLQLPMANDLPGTDKPSVAVALDANGRYFFEDQKIEEAQLRKRLSEAAKASPELVLIVQADKAATHDMLIRLSLLARDAGISEAWLATLPRPLPASP